MPYTDASRFVLQCKHRAISATGDITGSQFTEILDGFTGEANGYMHITTDFCTWSSATQESKLMKKVANDYIESYILYIEQAENIAVQNRVEMLAPSIYDPKYMTRLAPFRKEKREEHSTVITYNMWDGKVSKY